MRIGIAAGDGVLADRLKEAEMVVFWSSDPESTNGGYSGFEGTQRRLWAKELGINSSISIPISTRRPNCSAGDGFRPPSDRRRIRVAIMYVWVIEGLYDKDYVAKRTTGFDEWKAYLLGQDDGVPKTPEWQEAETGVPAEDAALGAQMGQTRRSIFASACPAPAWRRGPRRDGAQWARCMVMMMAMQGWGKPGVNFGGLQMGTPIDPYFYFPGYADGGISGELLWNGNALHTTSGCPTC